MQIFSNFTLGRLLGKQEWLTIWLNRLRNCWGVWSFRLKRKRRLGMYSSQRWSWAWPRTPLSPLRCRWKTLFCPNCVMALVRTCKHVVVVGQLTIWLSTQRRVTTWLSIWEGPTSESSCWGSRRELWWVRKCSTTRCQRMYDLVRGSSCLTFWQNASTISWMAGNWRDRTCRWASHSLSQWLKEDWTLAFSFRGPNLSTVLVSSAKTLSKCSTTPFTDAKTLTLT